MIKYIFFIFIIILTVGSSYSVTNEELYLKEFNLDGESCSISYSSVYLTSNNKLSKATNYICCTNNEDSCKIFSFDTHNLKPFSILDTKEVLTLDVITEKIGSGEIDKEIYSINNGFSSCEYLGYSSKLEQESINLGAIVADKGSVYLSENSKKMAKKLIWTGEKIGK